MIIECCLCSILIFFFKQKTAYEMRISDWSSDVCSSDLPANAATIRNIFAEGKPIEDKPVLEPGHRVAGLQAQLWSETIRTDAQVDYMLFPRLPALADRKSVV